MDIQLYKTQVSKMWGFRREEHAPEKRALSPAGSGSASDSCLGAGRPLWKLWGEKGQGLVLQELEGPTSYNWVLLIFFWGGGK